MGTETPDGKKLVRRLIARVLAKDYTPDPLLDADTSLAISRASAVIKGHGGLLCMQLQHALAGHDDLVVLPGDDFAISAEADQLAAEQDIDACRLADLPYDAATADRTVDVDLIVYNTTDQSITAYEIKRGHGSVDSGKRRQTLRDGYAVAAHLRDFARRRGYRVLRSDFKVVSIYGRTGLPVDVTINGDRIDAHFGSAVSGPLWQSERYLRRCVRAMLDGRDLPRA